MWRKDMWRKTWNRVRDWYTELEDWQIAVLERPELAARASTGYRRVYGRHLAAMTPVERLQMRDFCLAYRGRKGWVATAKVVALFCVMGVLLHLALGKVSLVSTLLLANLFGFSFLFGAVGVWFNSRSMKKGKLKILLQGLIGGVIGAALAYMILRLGDPRPFPDLMPRLPRIAAMAALTAMATGMPMYLLGKLRRRQHALLTEQLQRDAERERLARELSESQLRMLRAQIEPHFLFNTLGAVQQLAQDGAPRAAALTADLIDFLRASFSDMRCEQVELSTEFATTSAYLRVMQARMGARLRFDVRLPAPLAGVTVPSMIVLTLVENAIKHGIEPALRGGEIRVTADADGDTVTIRVQDSGAGMGASPGKGAGLENVRSRLQLAYGGAASLALHEAAPGLAAELRLPVRALEAA